MVRLKHRYLLVNILYPAVEKNQSQSTSKVPDVVVFNQPTSSSLTNQNLLRGLRAEISSTFGDFGMGAVSESLTVKYLSPATSTFILRVSRAHYRIVWAALSLMKSVPIQDGKKCVFRVVRVSGTIRKAEEEAIRRARDLILKAQREAQDKGEVALQDILGAQSDEDDSTKAITMVDRSDSEGANDTDDG
ncbi:hypothetical protein WAI453_003510 [Rhynchosporium graminicola]|uniref:Ribonuclease P/MRP protein subunit POP5 n=1 Tax=Rhynchosporium graminicola TaxID=2792576 RepID=A0A1E1KPC1_9HELO|nr:related to POP5 Protein required for processing of tRNAs and rRNAs [Rhynchosporium commune]